jgi:hypothetical protein
MDMQAKFREAMNAKELKQRGQSAIRQELDPIAAELRWAKNDGQATGMAMKHLRSG